MYKTRRGGRPPRRRVQPERPSKAQLSVGNCRVELPRSLVFSQDVDGLSFDVPDVGTITVKVSAETRSPPAGFSFTLVNPNVNAPCKTLLQDVLRLYSRELPAMNYAANTGKESPFLEKCILSGKYCTLILKNAELELIGAMTYQILPTDAHQAELPLAAVAHDYHRQGFGACLYNDLQRRLVDVGVTSIFCWGDQESEAFWAKQGFFTVAQVDGSGKPYKLPIKADARRAMSIPGSATLMISYLSTPSITPASCLELPEEKVCPKASVEEASPYRIDSLPREKICPKASVEEASPSRVDPLRPFGNKLGPKSSPPLSVTTPQNVGEIRSSQGRSTEPAQAAASEPVGAGGKFCATSITPLNMEGMLSRVASGGVGAPPSEVSGGHSSEEGTAGRPPLANISNSQSAQFGAIRPFKKRPFQVGQTSNPVDKSDDSSAASGTTTAVKGMDSNVSEVQRQIPAELKEPSASRQEDPIYAVIDDARKRWNGGSGLTAAASDDGPDRQSSKPSATAAPESKVGVKRRRELQVRLTSFGRRSARRRKVEEVPNVEGVSNAEGVPNGEEERKKEDSIGQTPDELRLMINLLLPQRASDHRGDAQIGASLDSPHPESGGAEVGGHLDNAEDKTPGLERECDCKESSFLSLKGVPGPDTLPSALSDAGQKEKTTRPVIMFMNMADEDRKRQLTKHVERLDGQVTNEGCYCTHVVTGEVRRTLNFCLAISSGAWIVSFDWLKTSVKQQKFVEETQFVLRDHKFQAKYQVSLEEVIARAKRCPNSLFKGMSIFPTPNIRPPVASISRIVQVTGGKILGTLEEVLQDEDNSAVIACEEDMFLAIMAAQAGLRTFSADWLLNCVAKQELELNATQFSESL